ncbi:MAG: hypothetical protein ABJH08_09255 [Balneola sp.]
MLRKVYFAFSPSAIFSINTKSIVSFLNEKDLVQNLIKDENTQDSKETNTETEIVELEKEKDIPDNVPILLVINRSLFFAAEKLKRFRESRVYIVFFILGLLFTFFLSSLIFGFINYGLYKIDPSAFIISGSENYFMFLYYSFNALIINSISSIEPSSALSMTINMIQIIYGIILVVILIGILVSVNTQRYRDDIDQVIYAFDNQSSKVEKAMEIKFKMNIKQAIEELDRAKHSFIELLKYLDPEQ